MLTTSVKLSTYDIFSDISICNKLNLNREGMDK